MTFRASLLLAFAFATPAGAQTPSSAAGYLFVGSCHMNNPGRDVHNTQADDVYLPRRQA